jgi:hypothetical protein
MERGWKKKVKFSYGHFITSPRPMGPRGSQGVFQDLVHSCDACVWSQIWVKGAHAMPGVDHTSIQDDHDQLQIAARCLVHALPLPEGVARDCGLLP